MKKIVVSAINFSSGGPLSVLQDALGYIGKNLSNKYEIVALVHNKDLFDVENIKYYEFSNSKNSWINRLFYEYIYFYFLSKKIKPYLWLSLHDMTPNIKAKKKAVYCHNPSPFYQTNRLERKFNKKFWLFTKYYEYIYRINIDENDHVIVQQDWLRSEFEKRFKIDNVIVANPNIKIPNEIVEIDGNEIPKKDFAFFYPSFPRVFKNFEVICETAEILKEKGIKNVKIYLTIDGTENEYSKYIYKKYKKNSLLEFIGLISREEVFKMYSKIDALIFPSKLETWGMPITEFKEFDKPIFLSDLEYAHETLGNYSKGKFFDPLKPEQLSDVIINYINNDIKFDNHKDLTIDNPYVKTWEDLFNILLEE